VSIGLHPNLDDTDPQLPQAVGFINDTHMPKRGLAPGSIGCTPSFRGNITFTILARFIPRATDSRRLARQFNGVSPCSAPAIFTLRNATPYPGRHAERPRGPGGGRDRSRTNPGVFGTLGSVQHPVRHCAKKRSAFTCSVELPESQINISRVASSLIESR
jgi:hypothetical protein